MLLRSLENEKMMYRLDIRKFSAMVTYNLEPVEDGTILTCAVDYEAPNLILGTIDKFYYRRRMDKEHEKSLENLKTILEQ